MLMFGTYSRTLTSGTALPTPLTPLSLPPPHSPPPASYTPLCGAWSRCWHGKCCKFNETCVHSARLSVLVCVAVCVCVGVWCVLLCVCVGKTLMSLPCGHTQTDRQRGANAQGCVAKAAVQPVRCHLVTYLFLFPSSPLFHSPSPTASPLP